MGLVPVGEHCSAYSDVAATALARGAKLAMWISTAGSSSTSAWEVAKKTLAAPSSELQMIRMRFGVILSTAAVSRASSLAIRFRGEGLWVGSSRKIVRNLAELSICPTVW